MDIGAESFITTGECKMKQTKLSKDGLPIEANGCAEDNSGCLVALANGDYQARMSYPVYQLEDGTEVYIVNLGNDRAKAVAEFKSMLGSFGYGE